jgi:WD40 repeat protein
VQVLGADERIICLAANQYEDHLFAITKSGQLIETRYDLKIETIKDVEAEPEFTYVMCPFHKAEVTGLDVCIRKQLIATCSKDKTVCVWNYDSRKLEIKSTAYAEECLTLAFHPSGLHLIVAL